MLVLAIVLLVVRHSFTQQRTVRVRLTGDTAADTRAMDDVPLRHCGKPGGFWAVVLGIDAPNEVTVIGTLPDGATRTAVEACGD